VSVEDVLAAARSGLARLKPYDAAGAMSDGGFLVDVRPEYQRRADGDIPGDAARHARTACLAPYDVR
jgi:hypothetical protein